MDTVDNAVERLEKSGRVCPLPRYWHTLYKMLPGKVKMKGRAHEPRLPLVLSAWWYSTEEEKFERFKEHLICAEAHGASQEVLDFLADLPDERWLMTKAGA